VRCSLEDVADNMFSTMRARGEKEMKIVRDVTETLKKTGASASVVGATIMPPLKELTGKREVYRREQLGYQCARSSLPGYYWNQLGIDRWGRGSYPLPKEDSI
jgi:hypothetical protein